MWDIRESVADTLVNIAQKHKDAIARHIPHLLTLIPTDSGRVAYRVILAIQENSKFYNYEIAKSQLTELLVE